MIGKYSWDNANETTNDNLYYGANSWERPSALKEVLNGAFLNSQSDGQCPYCGSGADNYTNNCQDSPTIACNFSSNGLISVKEKIEDMTWYLGGGRSTLGAEGMYEMERNSSTLVGYDQQFENDSLVKGTGQVGLMYPSDYGFAYGAGFGTTTCYESGLTTCNTEQTKNWLLDTSVETWTISSSSINKYFVQSIQSNGRVNPKNALYWYGVHPVVYLKSNISISNATGSVSDPYKIAS